VATLGDDNHRLQLPKLEDITLRNLSLYNQQPEISVGFGDGVTCFIGANGIGKSTFLNVLNFAVTGVIADRAKRFESVEEYYAETLDAARDYFAGRISERERASAEVEIAFTLGESQYRLVRGFFEPQQLRALTIDGPYATGSWSERTSSDRHQAYVERLTKDVGVDSFEQFVFLQWFVFTFDERRNLIFWSPRVAEQALFLTFGLDMALAQRADQLRREIERADSRVRNLQWQATQIQKYLRSLERTHEDLAATEVADDVDAVVKQRDDAAAEVARRDAALREADLRLAERTARVATARQALDEHFGLRLRARKHIRTHPVLRDSIDSGKCSVCGARSHTGVIKARLLKGECPLCSASLPNEADGTAAADDEAEALAAQLEAAEVHLEEAQQARARLAEEAQTSRGEFESAAAAVARLEMELGRPLSANTQTGDVDAVARSYGAQINHFLARKATEQERRDGARRELRQLQRVLARSYAEAEEQFAPRFSALARDFLGLDLQVDIQVQRGTLQLLLSLEGSERREVESLSESQRFFIDIALRMALAKQIAPTAPPPMLIDTPEGSLDIAYEARAGQMFARFVTDGPQLVMTANINSSQLLMKLASTLGRSRLRLVRMTEWRTLSDVQTAEEALFEKAYGEIHDAMLDSR
jgi:DNA repair exonuclease SbcCD ATPase subunit